MHPDENQNQIQENQENNEHQQKVDRSMNLIGMIINFLERLKNKQQPLESFVEEAIDLENEILEFIELLGDDREEWYFWKFVNEPQVNFFNMELHEILSILDDEEWPHPVEENGIPPQGGEPINAAD
jgi:hypothetical protein